MNDGRRMGFRGGSGSRMANNRLRRGGRGGLSNWRRRYHRRRRWRRRRGGWRSRRRGRLRHGSGRGRSGDWRGRTGFRKVLFLHPQCDGRRRRNPAPVAFFAARSDRRAARKGSHYRVLDAGAGADLDAFRDNLVAFDEVLVDPQIQPVGRGDGGPVAFRAHHGNAVAGLKTADLRSIPAGLGQNGGSRSCLHRRIGGGGCSGRGPEDRQDRYHALQTFHGPEV